MLFRKAAQKPPRLSRVADQIGALCKKIFSRYARRRKSCTINAIIDIKKKLSDEIPWQTLGLGVYSGPLQFTLPFTLHSDYLVNNCCHFIGRKNGI